MHKCPKCRSDEIHRSRARSKWESWRKTITGKQPFRCHKCGWRGWGVDMRPKFSNEELNAAARALAPDPPNLKGTARSPERHATCIDLDKLDSLHPVGDKQD